MDEVVVVVGVDGTPVEVPVGPGSSVGDLRANVAFLRDAEPGDVILASAGVLLSDDEVLLETTGAGAGMGAQCAILSRGESFAAEQLSGMEAAFTGSAAGVPGGPGPTRGPRSTDPGTAVRLASAASSASSGASSAPGSVLPDIGAMLGDAGTPSHLSEDVVPAGKELSERVEQELPRHGETGCTDDGAMTVVFSAGGMQGAVPDDVHTAFTAALTPRTLDWAANNPTAHFAVSVAAGGLSGEEFFRTKSSVITHCIGASGARPGTSLRYPDRGFWGSRSFERRCRSAVDQGSVCVVAMGQSAVSAWDLHNRLTACGLRPKVHGPSSCREHGPAEGSPAARLLRDRGVAIEAFPTWFPRVPMPPAAARVAWARTQPYASWEGHQASVPPLLFDGEVDTVTPAPFDAGAAISGDADVMSLRPRHNDDPVKPTSPDGTVAPLVDIAPGGVGAFSVYVRPPGDDAGAGAVSPEARAAGWNDVEEASGVDGGVPMGMLREAIEQALLQGDARDMHPTHYDLRERGLEKNTPGDLDSVWLQYRRGRIEHGNGCVLRRATHRQAEVVRRRLETAGLVAALHRDPERDEHLTDEQKALPADRPPEVSPMDMLFLRLAALYRIMRDGRTASYDNLSGALQRVVTDHGADLHRLSSEVRNLVRPTSFLPFVREVHRVAASEFTGVRPTSKDALDSFERWEWGDAARAAIPEADHSCAIYLMPFEEGESVTRLPCKHVFGTDAIQTWLATNTTCPVCRKSLPRAPNRLLKAADIWEPMVPEPDSDIDTGLPPSAMKLPATSSFGLDRGHAMALARRREFDGLSRSLSQLNTVLRGIAVALATPSDGRWDFAEMFLLPRVASEGFAVEACVRAVRSARPAGVPSIDAQPNLFTVLEAGGADLDNRSNIVVRRIMELLADVAQGRTTAGALEAFGWDSEGTWRPTTVPDSLRELLAEEPAAPVALIPIEASEATPIVRGSNLEGILRADDTKLRAVAAVIWAHSEEQWQSVALPVIEGLEKRRFEVTGPFRRMWEGERDREALIAGNRADEGRAPGNRAMILRVWELVRAGYNDLGAIRAQAGGKFRSTLAVWDDVLMGMAVELCSLTEEAKRALMGGGRDAGAAAAAAGGGAEAQARLIRRCEGPLHDVTHAVERLRSGERCMHEVTSAVRAEGSPQAVDMSRRLLELVRRLEGCEELAAAVRDMVRARVFPTVAEAKAQVDFYVNRLVNPEKSRPVKLGTSEAAMKRVKVVRSDVPECRAVLRALGREFRGPRASEELVATPRCAVMYAAAPPYLTLGVLQDDPLVFKSRWF